MSVSYGGDSITFADGSVQSGGWTGMRNRIINGAQVINQRAASVTASATYVTDRFQWDNNTTTATLTFAQSTTAPTGFTNSLGITVGTADTSIAAGDLIDFRHWIEGSNVADFGLGTAAAVTFTVSFWVRSSIVGTYGASFRNSDASRVYVSTFTINVANTWEQKTITVVGDTTGTWLTDTGRGLGMSICLTSGTNYQTTAGVWTGAGNFRTTSAQVNFAGTSAATFFITGVQLERGSTASSFEYRSYGSELALCQRYFVRMGDGNSFPVASAQCYSTTGAVCMVVAPQPMRATPTLSHTNMAMWTAGTSAAAVTALTIDAITVNAIKLVASVASGLVAGNASFLNSGGSSGNIQLSAEL